MVVVFPDHTHLLFLNTSSKRQIMDHYLATNSLFVSEILKKLQPVKYDDPDQNVYSLI